MVLSSRSTLFELIKLLVPSLDVEYQLLLVLDLALISVFFLHCVFNVKTNLNICLK